MTKQGKVVSGLLVGAAIGATIAIVMSSGKHDDLKDKMTDWLADLFSGTKEKLNDTAKVVKDKMAKVSS